jgi:hypothetical protein
MSAAERQSDRQVNNRPQQRGFAAAAWKLPNVAAVAKESGKDDGVRHIALYVVDVPSMERMEIEKDPVASTRKTASLFPSRKMTQSQKRRTHGSSNQRERREDAALCT